MSQVSRTNQVAYFARTCLDQAEQAASQEKRQLEEAALSHLYVATFSFANELVAQYRLEPFQQLEELFSRDHLPAELYELGLLSRDSRSWLHAVLKQYRRMLVSGLEDGAVGQPVQIITSQSDFTNLFRNWLIELEKTIQRMRLHYQEN